MFKNQIKASESEAVAFSEVMTNPPTDRTSLTEAARLTLGLEDDIKLDQVECENEAGGSICKSSSIRFISSTWFQFRTLVTRSSLDLKSRDINKTNSRTQHIFYPRISTNYEDYTDRFDRWRLWIVEEKEIDPIQWIQRIFLTTELERRREIIIWSLMHHESHHWLKFLSFYLTSRPKLSSLQSRM